MEQLRGLLVGAAQRLMYLTSSHQVQQGKHFEEPHCSSFTSGYLLKAVTVAKAERIPRGILENKQPHPPKADSTRLLALVKAY